MDQILVIALLLAISDRIVSSAIISEEDPGFDLYYTTNLNEMENVPIYFQNSLPEWLHGNLIRNGVGRFEFGERRFTHSFDAYGKLYSWKFYGNGSASFTTKFLQSNFYEDSVDKNDIAPYLVFESVQPPFNGIQKIEAILNGLDNMNINIYRLFNHSTHIYEYVALSDYWKIYQINPDFLNTLNSVIPDQQNIGGYSGIGLLSVLSSAHPLPEFGTTYHFTFFSTISLLPWIESKITLVRMKSMRVREKVASWPVDRVPYIHSFSVTENYVIIFAAPFYINNINFIRFASPLKGFVWHDNEPTTVFIVAIKSGKVTKLKTDTVFTLHHINAFEKGNAIVVDISSYPNPNFLKHYELSILRDPFKRNLFDAHAYLRRYIITLSKSDIVYYSITPSVFVPFSNNLDIPTINELYRSKHYCYVYGLVQKIDNVTFSRQAIVKKDLCRKNSDDFWFVEHQYPGEALFVPSPYGKREDDGILLVPILDGKRKQSFLACIDAVTMKMTNKAVLPTVMPFTVHGRFFGD